MINELQPAQRFCPTECTEHRPDEVVFCLAFVGFVALWKCGCNGFELPTQMFNVKSGVRILCPDRLNQVIGRELGAGSE